MTSMFRKKWCYVPWYPVGLPISRGQHFHRPLPTQFLGSHSDAGGDGGGLGNWCGLDFPPMVIDIHDVCWFCCWRHWHLHFLDLYLHIWMIFVCFWQGKTKKTILVGGSKSDFRGACSTASVWGQHQIRPDECGSSQPSLEMDRRFICYDPAIVANFLFFCVSGNESVSLRDLTHWYIRFISSWYLIYRMWDITWYIYI